jgi:hypothetical protein
MIYRRSLALVACLSGLTACSKPENPARADAAITHSTASSVDSAGVSMLNQAIAANANIVPNAIENLLTSANQAQNFPGDALKITVGDRGPYQIDGWMASRGFLTPLGQQYGRIVVTLSASGHALATANDPAWFTVTPGPLRNVDCKAGEALADASCIFDVTYTLSPTPAGRLALGQTAALQAPLKVQINKSASTWTLSSIQPDGDQPQEIILNSILGVDQARDQQRTNQLSAWMQSIQAESAAKTPTSSASNPGN